jgi:LDH2 family malate/lactate/ureidoglycolate dehydrogenase
MDRVNRTPDDFVRVPYEQMRSFVSTAAQTAGLPAAKADLLAELLATNDLRGVFSHGTQLIAAYAGLAPPVQGYARLMRDGQVNPDPDVEVVKETPVSVLLDGDGGLGYFPAYEGTQRAIEKAEERGIAAMATRNHGHFGAAGIYAREAVDRDLLAFVTSGHQLDLSPGDQIYDAAGGSPMSFCAPAAEEDPLVLDFGAMHDLYETSPHRDEIADLAPGLVLRHIGLGAICQSWGGLLAGLGIDEPRDYQEYPEANQGSLALFFRIDLFSDPDRFKREVDEYVRRVSELEPLEGFDRAMLPGGPEAERERVNRDRGVPVGPDHRAVLEELADELDLEVPWE